MRTRILVSITFFLVISLVTAGVVNAQSRNSFVCDETTLTLPENALVTSVETDGFSGSLTYTTADGVEEFLDLPIDYSYRYIFPMAILLDGKETKILEAGPFIWVYGETTALEDLEGKVLSKFEALKLECDYFAGAFFYYENWGTQWIIKAKVSTNTGGGGNPGKPVEFEGFLTAIDSAEVVIEKEGTQRTLTVTSQTQITLNGQSATLDDLLLGDKAKAKYDPATYEALQLIVER
ncbi:MAG: hypothetical protein D6736_14970 [Nitrospinota bacterium]|nr:MAG: hypothetical protein D6736_14970 [Nitrospinota bacterium]